MAANNTIVPIAPATVVKKRDWVQIEEMKAYYHEAGHAVIARLTDFPVAWVSVDSAFIKNNALAIENQCNHSSAVCLTVSSTRLTPILERRSALNKEAKNAILGYCMHVLAGPYAEWRFDPGSFYPEASVNDYGQVAQILTMVTRSNKTMRKKLYTTARRNLDRMLDQSWYLIQRVAYELYRQRTLSGDEVDEILVAAKQNEAA